jgi:hypothetical protein
MLLMLNQIFNLTDPEHPDQRELPDAIATFNQFIKSSA